MSADLIKSVAPDLATPVKREPVQGSTEDGGGTEPSVPIAPPIIFAGDDE